MSYIDCLWVTIKLALLIVPQICLVINSFYILEILRTCEDIYTLYHINTNLVYMPLKELYARSTRLGKLIVWLMRIYVIPGLILSVILKLLYITIVKLVKFTLNLLGWNDM